MIITEHLCGVAVAYQPERSRRLSAFPDPDKPVGRDQGSLINYQKRAIANAVEYIRQTATNRAMLFTLTSSHRWPGRARGKLLSMFIENMKQNYGMKEYCWVKEHGHKKPPHYASNIHYHFVADVEYFDPVALSVYWSGLFGFHCRSKNSIRLGSKPDKKGKRIFFINSSSFAWYLSKYLGKGISKKGASRSFGISQTARVLSLPECFEARLYFAPSAGKVLTASGALVDSPVSCTGVVYENEQGREFNKSNYKWTKAKDHQVWIGRKG